MLATTLRRLVQGSTVVPRAIVAPALVCPHCERELGESHDDAACSRRMSRRYFFGVAAGAASYLIFPSTTYCLVTLSANSQLLMGQNVLRMLSTQGRVSVVRNPLGALKRYPECESNGKIRLVEGDPRELNGYCRLWQPDPLLPDEFSRKNGVECPYGPTMPWGEIVDRKGIL